MKTVDNQTYVVDLSEQQWDVVVLCLGYVMDRAYPPSQPHSVGVIDLFARRVLRRRLNEIITEIQSNVTSAGSGSLDP